MQKVRIKKGAMIGQDFRFMEWPMCLAPGNGDEAADPDMLFDYDETASLVGDYAKVTAFGFGQHGRDGAYGCGCIHVEPKHLIKVDNVVEDISPARLNELLCDAFQRGFRAGVMKASKDITEAATATAHQLAKDHA